MVAQHLDRSTVEQTVGFVGDSDVGKTTVATLLADRLQQRSAVRVRGEAADFVEDSDQPGRLGVQWSILDCAAGPGALAEEAGSFDTAFVVTTPDTLGRVDAYEEVAAEHDIDCFLVVNRFTEAARERVQSFDGPELADYVYEREKIPAAMQTGNPPTVEDRTVEPMLIETLQSERTERSDGFVALERGARRIVNVEVENKTDGDSLVQSFEEAGQFAAYFRCNCRCHDGHVLARRPESSDTSPDGELAKTAKAAGRPRMGR